MSIFKFLLKNKGVTLVEVMVSAAMTAIVSLGVATMMQNSFKEQRRVVLLDTLKNQKSKFESMIRDQAIWNASMNSSTHNSAALFAQLRSASAVTEVSYTTPVEYKIVFSDGSLAHDFLGPSDNAGPYPGISEKGQNCSTFSLSTGTDDCPISYRLLIGSDCSGSATSCVNPQLKLVARLVFNPSATGTLATYRSFLSAVAGSDISDTVQDSKYDAVVKRTSTSVNRSFRIISRFTIGSSGCNNAGGGTCTNAFQTHPRSATNGWFVDYDPNSLVSATTGAVPGFSFRETGFYGCVISAPAFATDLFRLGLVNFTTDPTGASPIGSAQVTAGKWSQATAVVDVKFSVSQATNEYRVFQNCGVNLTTIPAADRACTLGVFTDYSSTPTVISMSCYKIDRAM
jgi:type II secretory pathway pseudopilin PulG